MCLALAVGLLPRPFDDCDLFAREAVEFIDETVDLAVKRGAFAFIEVLVTLRSRCGKLLFEHLSDEL
jgi:hypothetical protein